MTPLGSPSFGISVVPFAETYPQIVAQVLAAEQAGLDLVGIQDHPYQRRYLDTFALIADLLARTARIRIFPDVASLPMRPPAMLAKAAASLDVMSGGRFELGIGAGTYWDAVAGMGGEVRRRGERGAALEEAIRIARAALDTGPGRSVVGGPGPHYPLPGYPPGPPTPHRVEIWVGAMAPRAMEIVGRVADGWIPAGGATRVEEFGALSRLIDEAAEAAGRDPLAVRRILNYGAAFTGASRVPSPFDGPPRAQADALARLSAEHRVEAFVFWPPDPSASHVERFAAEVVPLVREALAQSPS